MLANDRLLDQPSSTAIYIRGHLRIKPKNCFLFIAMLV